MPRYQYDKLTVATFHSVDYPPTELRAAVEHLKPLEQRGCTGLTAETSVRAGNYRLLAMPFIKLDKIIGRTPDRYGKCLTQGYADHKSLIKRESLSYAPSSITSAQADPN